VTYVIAEPCVDLLDKACIEESVCPVEAIYYEDDVKDEWAAYTKANVDFFDELGSPGGASKVGKVAHDPQWIKDLPPMNTDE